MGHCINVNVAILTGFAPKPSTVFWRENLYYQVLFLSLLAFFFISSTLFFFFFSAPLQWLHIVTEIYFTFSLYIVPWPSLWAASSISLLAAAEYIIEAILANCSHKSGLLSMRCVDPAEWRKGTLFASPSCLLHDATAEKLLWNAAFWL